MSDVLFFKGYVNSCYYAKTCTHFTFGVEHIMGSNIPYLKPKKGSASFPP